MDGRATVAQFYFHARPEACKALFGKGNHDGTDIDGAVSSRLGKVVGQKRGGEAASATSELEYSLRRGQMEMRNDYRGGAVFVERLAVLLATDAVVNAAGFDM